jgi:translation elongation factor EF-Ts
MPEAKTSKTSIKPEEILRKMIPGKLLNKAIELSMYDIVYKPRTAIKAQDLSDFMAEWIDSQTPPKE